MEGVWFQENTDNYRRIIYMRLMLSFIAMFRARGGMTLAMDDVGV